METYQITIGSVTNKLMIGGFAPVIEFVNPQELQYTVQCIEDCRYTVSILRGRRHG